MSARERCPGILLRLPGVGRNSLQGPPLGPRMRCSISRFPFRPGPQWGVMTQVWEEHVWFLSSTPARGRSPGSWTRPATRAAWLMPGYWTPSRASPNASLGQAQIPRPSSTPGSRRQLWTVPRPREPYELHEAIALLGGVQLSNSGRTGWPGPVPGCNRTPSDTGDARTIR